MTKFSDFIRDPGTAGPPTKEGIRALGFALQSDFPVELEEYLWVGGAQTFSGGEKTQGQQNLGVEVGVDVQAYSAALASLAGLTTVANRMVYTTGADTYALTPLTAFARTLLDDADATAARATLGLTNIIPDDGSVTTVKLADGALSADVAGRAKMADGFVTNSKLAAGLAKAIDALTGAAGAFIRITGTATAVVQAIVGTVSQSAGTPTGAIIETGGNANGRYIRYADGTQICWNEGASVTTSTVAGSVFVSPSTAFTFPIAFSANPVVQPFARPTGSVLAWAAQGSTAVSATQCSVYVAGVTAAVSAFPGYVAFGRWF